MINKHKLQQFQQDLRNGMTLEATLQKHQLTLIEVWTELNRSTAGRPSEKKQYKNNTGLDPTGEKHIFKRNGRYTLRKYSRGKTRMYGVYRSMEDAVRVRDYCMEHGWVQRNIDRYCKILDVERCKGHGNCKVRYN